MCVRDRRYLGWRYKKPGAGYRIAIAEKGGELVGYAVTRVKREGAATVGYIVDMITDDTPGADAALLSRALLELLSKKADYALCWMLADKPYFKSLRELGFARSEDAFPSVNIVYQVCDVINVLEEVLEDPKNWYLTMGDSDVF